MRCILPRTHALRTLGYFPTRTSHAHVRFAWFSSAPTLALQKYLRIFYFVWIRGTFSCRRKCQFDLCYKVQFFSFSSSNFDFFQRNLGYLLFSFNFCRIFLIIFKCDCIAPAPCKNPSRTHFRTHNSKRLRTSFAPNLPHTHVRSHLRTHAH